MYVSSGKSKFWKSETNAEMTQAFSEVFPEKKICNFLNLQEIHLLVKDIDMIRNAGNCSKMSGLWRYDVFNSKTLFDFISFLNFFTVSQSAFSGNTHFSSI